MENIKVMHAMTFAEKNLRQAWNCIASGDLMGVHLSLIKTQAELNNATKIISDELASIYLKDKEELDS